MREPVTVLTDYMLAIASIIFGMLLLRRGNRMWALAFFFTALGSFFGGTYHGWPSKVMWKGGVYCIGLASLFLLLGATRNLIIRVVAVVLFLAYAAWMVTYDDFVYVIIAYGTSLLAVTILQIVAWIRQRARSAPWVIASVVVSVIAALVQQQTKIPYHNDIYHLIQLFGLWLLYRGGTFMIPAIARPTTQPT